MKPILTIPILLLTASCSTPEQTAQPTEPDLAIPRAAYQDKLEGFWLAQCIANWTGLITEMDKVGNTGEYKTGDFYTREDWGKPDQPNIWGGHSLGDSTAKIDFFLTGPEGIWGADDDTDVEYMYQHLLHQNETSILTPEQIRDGWLKHMKAKEENFLWVSNQKAFDLMRQGVLPPETSDPEKNEHFEMIDAQLTTEIFGLFAPGRPDVALKMAHLPIRTTARKNAAWAAEFYVVMHSLAAVQDDSIPIKSRVHQLAAEARKRLPNDSSSAKMFDFVKSRYGAGVPWEQARDDIYQRYQIDEEDGYDITSQNLPSNGAFASGINFAASIVSLLYGEGDLKETIKIGTLAGWDSDNPTATWGGMLGFMLGGEEVERLFGMEMSSKFNIHRTRQNFPNDGLDTFDHMAETGIAVIDRVVMHELRGRVDLEADVWHIPAGKTVSASAD